MNKGNFELLIMGAGRGGTSLIAGLLDGHSRLEIAFEQFASAYLMGRQLPAAISANYFERTRSFLAACDAQASQFPEQVWGNKITTEQLQALQKHNAIESNTKINLLDEFFLRTFESKKVIFILRDGRSCSISKVNRTGVDLEKACSRWVFSVKVYRYLREHQGNWYTLKYEDLVADPERIMRDVCIFLGLEFEPEMLLDGPKSPKMLAEYRQTAIAHKTPITAFPEQHLEGIRGELEYCGYL